MHVCIRKYICSCMFILQKFTCIYTYRTWERKQTRETTAAAVS